MTTSELMAEMEKEMENSAKPDERLLVTSKASPILDAIGKDADSGTSDLFTTVKTDSASKGINLMKLRCQLHRATRGIEMRMLDVNRNSEKPNEELAHSVSQKSLDEFMGLLSSPHREMDNESVVEAARSLKESSRKEVERNYLEFEKGHCKRSDLILSIMTEAFASMILALVEIEGWTIDTKYTVKEEVRKMAERLGLSS